MDHTPFATPPASADMPQEAQLPDAVLAAVEAMNATRIALAVCAAVPDGGCTPQDAADLLIAWNSLYGLWARWTTQT